MKAAMLLSIVGVMLIGCAERRVDSAMQQQARPPQQISAAAPFTSLPFTKDLEEGKKAFDRGDYPSAHGHLLIAASDGEPLAQELVGFMYALGDAAYPGVAQDLIAAGDWLDLAARNGRPAARHMYCAIVRRAFPDRSMGELHCFDGLDIEDRH